jgi:nucleotide-binding universal stress UspA family protein
MKTLLVCTDFSKPAEHAATYAAMIARQYKFGYITLFHAYRSVLHNTALPLTDYDSSQVYKVSMTQLKELKQQLEGELGNDTLISIKTADLVLGESIDELCREENCDMVVMGITGKSKFEEIIVGSETMNVAQNCHYPVLVVPSDASIQPVSRVLVACSLKEVSRTMSLDLLDDVLKLFNAPVFVLNVDNRNRDFSPQTPGEMYQMHYIFDKYRPEFAFVENEDKVAGILDYATKNTISVIITIPKNYNFFQKLIHKSTTQKLIYKSNIPVLTLHE